MFDDARAHAEPLGDVALRLLRVVAVQQLPEPVRRSQEFRGEGALHPVGISGALVNNDRPILEPVAFRASARAPANRWAVSLVFGPSTIPAESFVILTSASTFAGGLLVISETLMRSAIGAESVALSWSKDLNWRAKRKPSRQGCVIHEPIVIGDPTKGISALPTAAYSEAFASQSPAS